MINSMQLEGKEIGKPTGHQQDILSNLHLKCTIELWTIFKHLDFLKVSQFTKFCCWVKGQPLYSERKIIPNIIAAVKFVPQGGLSETCNPRGLHGVLYHLHDIVTLHYMFSIHCQKLPNYFSFLLTISTSISLVSQITDLFHRLNLLSDQFVLDTDHRIFLQPHAEYQGSWLGKEVGDERMQLTLMENRGKQERFCEGKKS